MFANNGVHAYKLDIAESAQSSPFMTVKIKVNVPVMVVICALHVPGTTLFTYT